MSRAWPSWWDWPLELSEHVLYRMKRTAIAETDLREMLEDARALDRDHEPGRWIVLTRLNRRPWEIVVELDFDLELVTVITVYPLD